MFIILFKFDKIPKKCGYLYMLMTFLTKYDIL